MFNLIPVMMFLLMQGAGGDGLTMRQQQALLDLAHRAQAAQSHGEIKTALAAKAGVQGADLAFWIQVFSAVGAETPNLRTPELPNQKVSRPQEPVTGPLSLGWSASVRQRDGPSAL